MKPANADCTSEQTLNHSKNARWFLVQIEEIVDFDGEPAVVRN